jgi:hypothetical protein
MKPTKGAVDDINEIVGVIFLKVKPGTEELCLKWIDKLFKQNPPNCDYCRKRNINNIDKICVEKVVISQECVCTSLGFFDFMFIIRTKKHELTAIEDFVFYCLRQGDINDCIVDTQTFIGITNWQRHIPRRKKQ